MRVGRQFVCGPHTCTRCGNTTTSDFVVESFRFIRGAGVSDVSYGRGYTGIDFTRHDSASLMNSAREQFGPYVRIVNVTRPGGGRDGVSGSNSEQQAGALSSMSCNMA